MKKFIVALAVLLMLIPASDIAMSSDKNPALRSGDPIPENLFIELAKMVNPAVVNVAVTFNNRNSMRGRDPLFDLFEQFMQPPGGGRGRGGSPRPAEPQGVGTGFVIEASGLAVTNNHVIDGADDIKVQFNNEPGKFYDAEVVGQDPRTDIALIKIKASKPLPTVKLGVSKDVQVGQWVAAFGNPYGHTFSMSKGIVSALGRQIREINALPFIQTDASINPGNSGGPLVNTKGEVIGVNSAIDARAQGIGFAIPIDHVKELIPQLKDKGRVVRGYIGVMSEYITPRAQEALNLPTPEGSLIMNVLEGSPASKAGVEPYDVIVEFGDRKITNPVDLSDAVKDTKIGASAKVVLFREGKKKTLNVVVEEPPDEGRPMRRAQRQAPSGQGQVAPKDLGFKVADYSPKLAKDFGIAANAPKRPIITEVTTGSPAARAGLRAGDLVLDVNRQKVSKASDVLRLLSSGQNMLRVQNGSQMSLVFLNL